MAGILYRMYDLNPKNPTTITDGIPIACSDVNAVYPIGSSYVRHAFIVLQDADIIVKNASGNTLQRGTDYFISASAADQRYSKDYNTAIYSGIKFKATGTYTVTSFISCGTYPRATWFNYLWDQLIAIRDTTVANLSAAVSALTTTVTNMSATVSSTAAAQSELSSLFSSHSSDTVAHVTSTDRARWDGKSRIYVVATIAARNALTGITAGDCAYVVDDGDGKRAEYMWTGTAFAKISDPDWENLSLAWANLTGIPSNVTALINAAGLTNLATALTVALRDSSGKMRVATPVAGDDGLTVANKEWVASQIASSGGGNLSTSDTTSTDGEIVVTDGTTGKLYKKSGTMLSTLLGYFTSGVANAALMLSSRTITSGSISQVITLGAGTYIIGNAVTGIPLSTYFRATYSGSTNALSGSGSGTLILEQGGTQKRFSCHIANGTIYYGAGLTATAFSSATWTQETDAYGRAMRQTIVSIATSVDVLATIIADANVGVENFRSASGATNVPVASTSLTYRVKWIDASTKTCRVEAWPDGADKSLYEIKCTAGTWETSGTALAGWSQLRDSSGNAMNANSLGGVAAANYALKTDTAPDSSRLGGVAFSTLFVTATDTRARKAISLQPNQVYNSTSMTDGNVATAIKFAAGSGSYIVLSGLINAKTAYAARADYTSSSVLIYFTDGTTAEYGILGSTVLGACRFAV